jgi:hypothetical protein
VRYVAGTEDATDEYKVVFTKPKLIQHLVNLCVSLKEGLISKQMLKERFVWLRTTSCGEHF